MRIRPTDTSPTDTSHGRRARWQLASVCLLGLWLCACGDTKPASRPPVRLPPAPLQAPPPGPVQQVRAFYFGHSLVGHDLPQMIGAFARARSKRYAVNGQVGWGTPLMSHSRWDGRFDADFVPKGFDQELAGSLLFDMEGHAALRSGRLDAIVLTETAGFVQGTPGHWKLDCDPEDPFGGCTVEHLTKLLALARKHNPQVRTFLYTNWKDFGELGGIDAWLADIRAHVGWWEEVADRSEAQLYADGVRGPTLVVIPAALVLAQVVEQAHRGELAALGLADHTPLFTDKVHLSLLGFYVIAVTHYAALFRESPVGLPHSVDIVSDDKRSLVRDGFRLDPRLAQHIQQVAWRVLTSYPRAHVLDRAP